MVNFVWNTDKAIENVKNHGIDFVTASRVFTDPGRYEEFDVEHSQNEDRWVTIGSVRAMILFVVFTERNGDTIRIISARKAKKDEQKTYYQIQSRP